MRIIGLLAAAILALSGCVTAPRQTSPSPPANTQAVQPPIDPSSWSLSPNPTTFDGLPRWQSADLVPGLAALRRSCELFEKRGSQNSISSRAKWTGTVDDWVPACAALDVVTDAQSARAVLEALFTPVEIDPGNTAARFTGYFEPTYAARLSPQGAYTEPIPARPADLITESGVVYQVLSNGRKRPYPTRAEITRRGVQPLAYARPSDVFFLQIQGSGRLVLPDGRTLRAVYAANNGHPFKSTANWLMQRGWIARSEASMNGIQAWMDRAPENRVREAMNANPRFVFFNIEPEGDPALGPKGSFGVPLTPLGSMAVDTSLHANGVPMFVQTTAPGLGGSWSGLLVAQDTGGAIRGPVRGDIYFGTGPSAGAAADTVNAPGRLWVLLPRAVAERLRLKETTSATRSRPIMLTP